jgi:hypothetical protein
MRGAVIKLAVAISVIAVAYIVAALVLPNLGLEVGFEAGLVMQGLTVAAGFIIAGAICCVAAVQSWRALRNPPSRPVLGYAVLSCSTLIALVGAYFLISVIGAALAPWT